MQISQAALQGTGPFMHSSIPAHSAFHSCGTGPGRLPAELVVGFVDLKMELACFM